MAVRNRLRGGCVELFNLVAVADSEHDVSYFDINSLYPFICLKNKFVVGPGLHLLGPKMVSRLSLDRERGCFLYHDPVDSTVRQCDGVMQVRIGIPANNHSLSQFPFLPIRNKEPGTQNFKTFRASCLLCLENRHKGLCKHSMSQRVWRDTYTCGEVAYAVAKLNYQLVAIEEALVYPEQAYIFADYMKILASKKIKYGSVPKAYQSNLSQYCEEINTAMEFDNEMDRLTPDLLEENPYQCQFIKGMLNMGIGKLSQNPNHSQEEFVQDEQRLAQLLADKNLQILSCFNVTDTTTQVKYEKRLMDLRANRRTQMVIGAQVTAMARIYLDQSLRTLQNHGCQLIYTGKKKDFV